MRIFFVSDFFTSGIVLVGASFLSVHNWQEIKEKFWLNIPIGSQENGACKLVVLKFRFLFSLRGQQLTQRPGRTNRPLPIIF